MALANLPNTLYVYVVATLAPEGPEGSSTFTSLPCRSYSSTVVTGDSAEREVATDTVRVVTRTPV